MEVQGITLVSPSNLPDILSDTATEAGRVLSQTLTIIQSRDLTKDRILDYHRYHLRIN